MVVKRTQSECNTRIVDICKRMSEDESGVVTLYVEPPNVRFYVHTGTRNNKPTITHIHRQLSKRATYMSAHRLMTYYNDLHHGTYTAKDLHKLIKRTSEVLAHM